MKHKKCVCLGHSTENKGDTADFFNVSSEKGTDQASSDVPLASRRAETSDARTEGITGGERRKKRVRTKSPVRPLTPHRNQKSTGPKQTPRLETEL